MYQIYIEYVKQGFTPHPHIMDSKIKKHMKMVTIIPFDFKK